MAKQISALEMFWRESDRNRRHYTDEERNAAQKPEVAAIPPVIAVLMDVVEERCKARGGFPFYCKPADLLLLTYKKSCSVYDAEFHRMLAGNCIDEFINVMRPHMKRRNIVCSMLALKDCSLLRFQI
jgi:hypothetical protein